MDFLSSVIGLCLIWILIKTFQMIPTSKANHRKLPPGPKPFPVIGNLLELGDQPHRSLTKLAKAYGPIMTLKLGRITTIVISSADMAKEILQTHGQILSNRPIPDALRAHEHSDFAMPWLPVSSKWRNLRKICKDQLFSNTALDAKQDIRRKKVQELLIETRKSSLSGEAVEIGQAAFKTSLNLLSNTILSVDLADPNSDAARKFKEIVCNLSEGVGKPNVVDYFPLLQKLDPQGIRWHMTVNIGKMIDLFSRMINERLQFRRVSGFIINNDMLDTLLNINEENSEKMNKTTMEHFFLDLFVAGTDPTSTTLEWAMAELLHNPKTLSKAKIELQQVIGEGHLVEESDLARLPYLQAVVKETFRLHPPIPFYPRKVEEDVEINNYIIPKGAQVLVNAWAIGRDPSLWEKANSFMPERFIGLEIDVKGRNFELIPFGSGRRMCPGLPLAIRMLHLMLGSLIHTFGWKLEDGIKCEDMNMDDKFVFNLQIAHPLRAVPILG